MLCGNLDGCSGGGVEGRLRREGIVVVQLLSHVQLFATL